MSAPELQFKAEPHPFPGQPGSDQELWGTIRGVADDRELFNAQWDLAEFAEWFAAHLRAFQYDRLTDIVAPEELVPGDSLARSLRRLPSQLIERDDASSRLDQLFEYRRRHVLRFGMRGALISPVVLGMNGAVGELSLCNGAEWVYTFPMPSFLADAALQLRNLLLDWRTAQPGAVGRADALLNALLRG